MPQHDNQPNAMSSTSKTPSPHLILVYGMSVHPLFSSSGKIGTFSDTTCTKKMPSRVLLHCRVLGLHPTTSILGWEMALLSFCFAQQNTHHSLVKWSHELPELRTVSAYSLQRIMSVMWVFRERKPRICTECGSQRKPAVVEGDCQGKIAQLTNAADQSSLSDSGKGDEEHSKQHIENFICSQPTRCRCGVASAFSRHAECICVSLRRSSVWG